MRLFALFAILCFATPALATPPLATAPAMARQKFAAANAYCTTTSCKVLSAVAANAAAAARTFKLPVSGFSKLTIQLDFTRSAATDVRLACTGSLNNGATYAQITSTAVASGVGTVTPYYDTFATSASANLLLEYDVRTFDSVECVWSATGGGANDKTDIYAQAAVGI